MPESTDFTTWLADWAAVVTAVAVLGAAVFAWFQVRVVRETRHSQVMSAYYERWGEEQLRTARRLTARTSPQEMLTKLETALATDEYYLMVLIPEFFEDLALSVKHRAVTLEVVDEWIGGEVASTWRRWSLVAKKAREGSPSQPRALANFEALEADVLALQKLRDLPSLRFQLFGSKKGELGTRLTGRSVRRG